jgi:hypothetical protein
MEINIIYSTKTYGARNHWVNDETVEPQCGTIIPIASGSYEGVEITPENIDSKLWMTIDCQKCQKLIRKQIASSDLPRST